MLRARTLFAALLVACLFPVVAAADESQTERFHKVVPLSPGGMLRLKNFSGHIRITGADVNQVTIDAVRRADRERLDHIKLTVESSGTTVTVEANRKDPGWEHHNNNVVKTEFEIQVPRQTRLDIDAFSSPVRIAGVTGEQHVHTFSGRVEVLDAPGRFNAKTFSGPVDVRFLAEAGDPQVTVETFSGPIDLRMPEGVRGRVEFNTFSGDLRSDFPMTLLRQSRRRLVGDLGGGGSNQVQLKTFSGDVTIGR